ncbi:MAG: S-layer homology domain-containing protein [Oscillospiraceae bacterium]|nr:S-layer homology domain-containing protein [Oscillospiraceae bacterium]
MSRNEFAVLLVNLMNMQTVAERPYGFPLTDVPENWAAPYVYAVFEAGFIRGFPDGTFRGERFVTRAEAASMLNAALDRSPVASDWAEITEIPFTDLRRGYWAFYELLEASIEHWHMPQGGIDAPGYTQSPAYEEDEEDPEDDEATESDGR